MNQFDKTKKYLITGGAGFIGFHLTKKLLSEGAGVIGFDNLNDYYDVNLKLSRLALLQINPAFRFLKGDLADRNLIAQLFVDGQFQRVIHLGAQAGVRYSLDNPHAYADANLVGHLNILEGCRQHKIEHLLYASSSSAFFIIFQFLYSVGSEAHYGKRAARPPGRADHATFPGRSAPSA